MREELGAVRYTLGKPMVFMRHERKERTQIGGKARIFGIGYDATMKGKALELSARHPKMQWVEIRSFKPERYFTGGWLKGVREYLALKRRRKS